MNNGNPVNETEQIMLKKENNRKLFTEIIHLIKYNIQKVVRKII